MHFILLFVLKKNTPNTKTVNEVCQLVPYIRIPTYVEFCLLIDSRNTALNQLLLYRELWKRGGRERQIRARSKAVMKYLFLLSRITTTRSN